MARSAQRSNDLVLRVAQQIAVVRRARGLTQEALADALDIATKNVQRMESGTQNLTLQTIARTAVALGVGAEMLFPFSVQAQSGAPRTSLARLAAAGFRTSRTRPKKVSSTTVVPVTSVRAAAGRPTRGSAIVETVGWVSLVGRKLDGRRPFVAVTEGDSMAPKIEPGAIVLFADPLPGRLEGRTVVLSHDVDDLEAGPFLLKMIVRATKLPDGRTRLVLRSANPRYEDRTMTFDEDATPGFLAEVVEVLC